MQGQQGCNAQPPILNSMGRLVTVLGGLSSKPTSNEPRRSHHGIAPLHRDRRPCRKCRMTVDVDEPRSVGVRACVFDAYGTLFDFAAAARGCRDVVGTDVDRLTALWRDKQLQYTGLRAAQGRHADFWQVTGDALDFALETLGIDQRGVRDRLMALYLTLDPFPEVPHVLKLLKSAGITTAILSNGTPKMLDAAVKSAKLEALLDTVLSVEDVGVYKPHPRVYLLAIDRLFVPASVECLGCLCGIGIRDEGGLVQSLWPAHERLPGAPDHEIASLSGLPAIVGVA